MNYTITLTETEKKALEYVAYDPDEWIKNAATNRADRAIKEIVEKNATHCNEKSIAIAVGQNAQVDQAYSLGVIQTAKARQNATQQQ